MPGTDAEEPEFRLAIDRQEFPDEEPIPYTLVGRDDERREAYYFKGLWGWRRPDEEETHEGPTLEA
jgi:hypothetical protein